MYNNLNDGTYLRPYDWSKTIQAGNLAQIINNTPDFQTQAAMLAQEEAVSMLRQKYDTSAEFTPTQPLSWGQTYVAGSRWEWNFPAFSQAASYAVGDGVTGPDGTSQYLAVTAVTPGAFDPAQWWLGPAQHTLQFVQFPYPRFDYECYYQTGSRVWWRDQVFQAQWPTQYYDHQAFLQARVYANLPSPNNFPGQPIPTAQNPAGYPPQWATGVPYGFSFQQFQGVPGQAIPAWSSATAYTQGQGTTYVNPAVPGVTQWYAAAANTDVVPGSDISTWLPVVVLTGDNRSQQLLTLTVDIALFHLHSRIAPQNVPELRIKRYEMARDWLQAAAHGNVTPQNLFVSQPPVGSRIAFGGNVKKTNSF